MVKIKVNADLTQAENEINDFQDEVAKGAKEAGQALGDGIERGAKEAVGALHTVEKAAKETARETDKINYNKGAKGIKDLGGAVEGLLGPLSQSQSQIGQIVAESAEYAKQGLEIAESLGPGFALAAGALVVAFGASLVIIDQVFEKQAKLKEAQEKYKGAIEASTQAEKTYRNEIQTTGVASLKSIQARIDALEEERKARKAVQDAGGNVKRDLYDSEILADDLSEVLGQLETQARGAAKGTSELKKEIGAIPRETVSDLEKRVEKAKKAFLEADKSVSTLADRLYELRKPEALKSTTLVKEETEKLTQALTKQKDTSADLSAALLELEKAKSKETKATTESTTATKEDTEARTKNAEAYKAQLASIRALAQGVSEQAQKIQESLNPPDLGVVTLEALEAQKQKLGEVLGVSEQLEELRGKGAKETLSLSREILGLPIKATAGEIQKAIEQTSSALEQETQKYQALKAAFDAQYQASINAANQAKAESEQKAKDREEERKALEELAKLPPALQEKFFSSIIEANPAQYAGILATALGEVKTQALAEIEALGGDTGAVFRDAILGADTLGAVETAIDAAKKYALENFSLIGSFAKDTEAILKTFADTGEAFLADQLAGAVGLLVDNLSRGEKAFLGLGDATKKATVEAIKALGGQFAVEGAGEVASGVKSLARKDVPGALLHFKSAALFAGAATLAGVGGGLLGNALGVGDTNPAGTQTPSTTGPSQTQPELSTAQSLTTLSQGTIQLAPGGTIVFAGDARGVQSFGQFVAKTQSTTSKPPFKSV